MNCGITNSNENINRYRGNCNVSNCKLTCKKFRDFKGIWSHGLQCRSFESHQALLEHSPVRVFFFNYGSSVLNKTYQIWDLWFLSFLLKGEKLADLTQFYYCDPPLSHPLLKKCIIQQNCNQKWRSHNEKSEIFGKSMTNNFLLDKQEWCIGESTFGLGLNHGINTIILWVEFVMFSCLFQKISLLIHAYLNQESDSS